MPRETRTIRPGETITIQASPRVAVNDLIDIIGALHGRKVIGATARYDADGYVLELETAPLTATIYTQDTLGGMAPTPIDPEGPIHQ